MKRHLLLLGALALHGCSDDAETTPAAPHASRLRIRLAVADLRAPTVTLYDVADREMAGTLALAAPAAALVASQSGDTALALPRGGGAVQVLSGGVAVIPHKDHIHIFKSPAEVLGAPIAGSGDPTAAFGDGKWGVFFAGEAGAASSAVALTEAPWLQGKREPIAVATPAAHRGFAVPFAGDYLVSRPSGVDVVAAGGAPSPLAECLEPSAATTTGTHAAFACLDGLVVVSADRVAAPVTLPAGVVATSLEAQTERPFLLGRAAPGQLFALELATRAVSSIDVGEEPCDAVLEVGTTPRVVILTSAGRVVRIDLPLQAGRDIAGVVPPFACAAEERPRLAATPGRAWVSSPRTGEVLEIDTDGASPVRKIAVGGAPGPIAILGLEARNADLAVGTDELTD